MIPWWARGLALDRRSLALFRVALGLSLLTNLLLRFPDLGAFYTDAGVLPRSTLVAFSGVTPTLHLLSGSWGWQAGIVLLGMAAAVALIVGYRPTTAIVVSWIILGSLIARNSLVTHGGDSVLLTLTFWAMFLPLGGRGTLFAPASVAFILQLCAIYWASFALKMHPAWTTEGSALYYALNLDVFATPLARWLRQYELSALTMGTLALEGLGPFLALTPWPVLRLLAVILFVGFHLGIAATLGLGTFPWFCIAGWLALTPGFIWDRLGWRNDPTPWTPRGSALVIVGLAVVTAILMLPPPRPEPGQMRSPAFRVLRQMGLVQRWGMFAPYPWRDDVYLAVNDSLLPYRNTRWIGLAYRLHDPSGRPYRKAFGRYICRTRGLDSIRVSFVVETTPPPGEPAKPAERQVFWEGACRRD